MMSFCEYVQGKSNELRYLAEDLRRLKDKGYNVDTPRDFSEVVDLAEHLSGLVPFRAVKDTLWTEYCLAARRAQR